MHQQRFLIYGFVLLSMLCLLGCGGGGGDSQAQQVFGYADFSVVWPTRQRIVPNSAQSISITVTDGAQTTKNLVITYPATSISFNPLPFGTFTYTALACPNQDGTGTPVGKATGSFTITQQQYHAAVPLTADIASTIASISITPQFTTLKHGETRQLSINPLDASGNIVLTNQTLTVQSSNPSVVSISNDYQVTGLTAGSSTITASESDSGKNANLSISVPQVTVNVSPTTITLYQGAGQDFSATVGGAANTGVTWTVQEGSAGGSISTSGHYTASSTTGTYHVVATSAADSAVKAIATVTVNMHIRIYVTDINNDWIAGMDGMTGAGWTTFGSHGNSIANFYGPRAIAVDQYGKIYIADDANNRIVKINGLTGTGWITLGGYQFNNPYGIAIGPDGKIYVADTGNNRIVRMSDMTGADSSTLGAFGGGVGQFSWPMSVAVGPDNKIYVADYNNGRITRMDDMAGTNWTTLGSTGNGINQFNEPTGIAVGPDGKIYVVDMGNDRIVRVDDMTGAGWKTLGGYGTGANAFCFPETLAIGPDSKIYIMDCGNSRIVRMDDMTGAGWTTLGNNNSTNTSFSCSWGIAVYNPTGN